MGQTTGISWAHSTANFIRGCIEESPACDACYAREMAKRNPQVLGKWGSEADGGTRVVAAHQYWQEPLKWNKQAEGAAERPRVFCLSLGDLFEEWNGPMIDHKGYRLHKSICGWLPEGPDRNIGATDGPVEMQDVRDRVFAEAIDVTPNLNWLLLTKRPQNILPMWPRRMDSHPSRQHMHGELAYRPNVWLGTTCENQEYADKRIPELLKARSLSPVLWLSCEPLLGPINLFHFNEGVLRGPAVIESGGMTVGTTDYPSEGYDDSQTGIDWVICGCESGSKARPTQLDWVRSLRDQCQAAGVAFFVKQLVVNGKLRKQLEDFPSDLQIQQVPEP